MKVEAHVMAFNEAETIHLTIKHYQKFCDRIVLHDNFSTDQTRDIALSMGCDVRLFGKAGVLDDREYTKLKNNCWKNSDADWVIVVDADEILWSEDVLRTLENAKRLRFSIIETQGWQVVSHDVPRGNWLEITNGFAYDQYSKYCVFNPKAVKEINYIHGCHIAKPVYDMCIMKPQFMLFHYRNVGGPQRLVYRHAMYRQRMSDWNIRWKAGGHYLYDDEQRIREWNEQYERSKPFYLHGTESYLPDTQSQKND